MIKFSKVQFWDYLYIIIGTFLYAVGTAFLLLPYKLTTGGVAGIGALIFYVTGFEVQNTYLLVNLCLLGFAVKELGWRFCVKTITAVLTLTFWLWAMQRVYEICGSPFIVGDELFMACLIGAIMEGAGLALCFVAGGSTGGTDIIAAIINKYRNVSLGTVIMLLDIIIISSCYFVFHDIQRVIFGYVLLIVSSITLDYCISRNRQAVEFKIYSRNPVAIANAIIKNGRGATIMDGVGFYTKSERKVIVSVVRRREQMIWLRLIKSIDPYAFVTMANVSGVWGEGFDVMKVKEKKSDHKRKVLVFIGENDEEFEVVRSYFNKYDVRSLEDIGVNLDKPVSPEITTNNAFLRAGFVKRYYGFDCISSGKTLNDSNKTIFAVSTGDAVIGEVNTEKFDTIEEAKAHLDSQK